MNFFHKLFRCNHTLKVYSIMNCIASEPKELIYRYPGCFNIPTFDRSLCLTFDPPETPDSYRQVRNLTYMHFQTQPDFRFKLNITWLPPLYPYVNVTRYKVTYGNAANRLLLISNIWYADFTDTNWKDTFIEMKNLLPNTKYKYTVQPFILLVRNIELSGTMETPRLPANQLIVQNMVIHPLGFSDNNYYSYNVTWQNPKFQYGHFVDYAIFTKGNLNKTVTTTNTFHVVRHIQHSQPCTIEIKPMYSENWITGLPITKTVVGDVPPKENLTVRNLDVQHQQENKVHNSYAFSISWKSPTFHYKTLDRYQITYSLSGYPYHAIDCKPGVVRKSACGPNSTKETRYTLAQVLPSEHIVFTVTPVFLNSSYVKGITRTIKTDAPYPRRSLVEVRNLTYVGINEINGSKKLNFTWLSPQFKHSKVSKYNIKYFIKIFHDTTSKPSVEKVRRSASLQNQTKTMEHSVQATHFYAPVLESGKLMTLEVTPVFDVEIIVGEKSTITVSGTFVPTTESPSLSPLEKSAIVLGVVLFLLMLIIFLIWFVKRQKQSKNGLVGGKGAIIDLWEVPVDKILLEDEIGEGAFGKVYKAILLELPEQSAKYSIARSIRRKSLKPLNQDDGYVVAAKMLHDMADPDQRREFLKEIQLMKEVGSHRNIVNMLGCGTLSEPMFLIVEYLPNGDLLHYLRKRRGKVKNYPDSDPRGPYHSTYCQTYFNKNNPEAGISLQSSRSDRVYVHSPKVAKEHKKGEIQLLSVHENQGEPENPTGDASRSDVEEFEMEDLDDSLTPGDLMAFAWQVSQGMEYLSKRGYVHRDLAARNVLVGNNKEAKIADFGLTRHMYENLYQAKTNRKLPLKWMSVEAIFDQSFTSQSDVWAYGVFLWELVTLGGTPYPSINNRELLKLLKEGYRMEKPETCDDELYAIMQSCWRELPRDRSTFEDIREKMEEMMTRDNPYFDPSAVDESRDYYNVPSFNSAPEDDDAIVEIIGEASSSPRDENQDSDKNTLNDKYSMINDKNQTALNLETPIEDSWTIEENSSKNNEPEDVELDQVMFDNDQMELASQSKSEKQSMKYAKLDFDDLEFHLYRRNNQGFVL